MLGADIGTHSVKMVRFSERGVEDVRGASYPGWPEPAEEGPQALVSGLVSQIGCRGDEVWGSMGGRAVIMHVTEFPRMADDELRSAVELEAEEFVLRRWDEMDFDFDVLETLSDNRARVLLVAVPREVSDRRTDVLRASGLYCAGITTDAIALLAAYRRCAGQLPKKKLALLVNIGAVTTNIVLLSNGTPAVLRDVAFGGNTITEAIARDFEVPFERAEDEKTSTRPANEKMQRSTERAVEPLMEQLSRTIGYEVRRLAGSGGDVMIYLCGGASRTKRLKDLVADRFGYQVEFFDPFLNLHAWCSLPADVVERSRYAVAVGCGLMGGAG